MTYELIFASSSFQVFGCLKSEKLRLNEKLVEIEHSINIKCKVLKDIY